MTGQDSLREEVRQALGGGGELLRTAMERLHLSSNSNAFLVTTSTGTLVQGHPMFAGGVQDAEASLQITSIHLQKYLEAGRGRLVLLEDQLADPADPVLPQLRLPRINILGTLYYCLDSRSTREVIVRTVRKSRALRLRGLLLNADALESLQQLDAVAWLGEYAKFLIVGIYDGEAEIIWEIDRKSPEQINSL